MRPHMKKKFLTFLLPRPGFVPGMLCSLALGSVLSYAASNIPGIFVFSNGAIISASEMNQNFEKISGVIILQAGEDFSATYDHSTISGNYKCMASTIDCYSGRLELPAASIGTMGVAVDSSPTNTTYSDNYSFFEIPSDGWYEIQLRANPSTRTTSCLTANCNGNFSSVFRLKIFKTVDDLPGNSSTTVIEAMDNYYYSDTSSNGNIEGQEISANPGLGLAKKVFLQAGQAISIDFEINVDGSSIDSNDHVIFAPGDLALSVIRL